MKFHLIKATVFINSVHKQERVTFPYETPMGYSNPMNIQFYNPKKCTSLNLIQKHSHSRGLTNPKAIQHFKTQKKPFENSSVQPSDLNLNTFLS